MSCLISCRKFDSNYYEGTVIEANSGIPIQSATVTLQYWNYAGKGGYNYEYANTNSEGNFSFDHRKYRGWSYRMWAEHADYYRGSSLDLTKKKPRPPYTFELTAPAFVSLRVKKNTAIINTITVSGTAVSFASGFKPGLITPAHDTQLTLAKIQSGRQQNISWSVISYTNGSTSPATGTVSNNYTFSLNKNDTLKYLIEYD